MKSLIKLTFLLLIFIFNSCGFGLSEELNKDAAEKLIKQNSKTFNDLQLEDCNAQEIYNISNDFLFVTNSFNGEFNGYIYSTKDNLDFKNLKFKDLYITSFDETIESWTKVTGKW